MTDVSVDIETLGTDPEHSAIIQIGAIKFNYDTGEVGEAFNRCLWPAIDRTSDPSTLEWWKKNPEIYRSIGERAEDPAIVMRDFYAWSSGDLRMWAKPTSFEFPFLTSYFRQHGFHNPYHYRQGRDLNSFIAGMANTANHQTLEREIEFVGEPHDALDDAIHQLKVIFKAKELRG